MALPPSYSVVIVIPPVTRLAPGDEPVEPVDEAPVGLGSRPCVEAGTGFVEEGMVGAGEGDDLVLQAGSLQRRLGGVSRGVHPGVEPP